MFYPGKTSDIPLDVEASKEGENANSTYFHTYLDAK